MCKCVWAQNGQWRETEGIRTDASFEKHDDAMHMMTWCNAKVKEQAQKKHTAKLGIAGSLLERRSRGVTTLHHYERISSRDLEWHRRENGREREAVKLSCFFDKRVKPRTLQGWTNSRKEYNEGELGRKHSVRNEGQRALRKPWGWREDIYRKHAG